MHKKHIDKLSLPQARWYILGKTSELFVPAFKSVVDFSTLISGFLHFIFSDQIWAASWQNQQNGMCAQRRLRSAWASAQSDQSIRCPHEETLGP